MTRRASVPSPAAERAWRATARGAIIRLPHRDAYRRWDRFEDVAVYAVLAGEWTGDAS